MKLPALTLALVVLAAGAAQPATIVIDNGSAPPDPANVISAATPFDDYEVRNSPGGDPTAVVVVDPAAFFFFNVFDSSSAVLEGGTGQFVGAGGQSSLVITGGTFDFIGVGHNATLRLEGGGNGTHRDSGLETYGDSRTTILGGTVSDNGLSAYDRSRVRIRGGSFVGLDFDEPLPGRLTLYDEGVVVRVHGSGFAIDGVPVPFGLVTAIGGDLTGTLASGESLDVGFFRAHPGARLYLVPEPGPALPLAGLAAALAARRAAVRAEA